MGQRLRHQQGVGDNGQPGDARKPASQLLRGRPRADHDGLALFDEARGEIGDGRLLRGRGQGFLRKAGLPRKTARQYRTAVPAVEESFCLQCPHVPPYGHFGGLDDAGELTERHGPVGAHHFEDQLATFCSEHETDSNLTGRRFQHYAPNNPSSARRRPPSGMDSPEVDQSVREVPRFFRFTPASRLARGLPGVQLPRHLGDRPRQRRVHGESVCDLFHRQIVVDRDRDGMDQLAGTR